MDLKKATCGRSIRKKFASELSENPQGYRAGDTAGVEIEGEDMLGEDVEWNESTAKFFRRRDSIVDDVQKLMKDYKKQPYIDPARLEGCQFHDHTPREECLGGV